MIKLTHNKGIAVRIGSEFLSLMTEIKVIPTAEILTVNWNCKNFRILSNTLLPHNTALTRLAKLSSSSTISDASFATAVPCIPIENPTSAAFNAGPSFVPK
eukprot:NODE_15_length_42055_cov_0.634117.p26 type:complete len:101 gc:universal NODE_15_length_42055_cov_0.634117:39039-39341(+)